MSEIEPEREWYIYVLKCPTTDEVRYVGFTYDIERRIRDHIKSSKHLKTHKACWIKSLLKLNLQPIIEVIDGGVGDWQSVEKYWILYYRMQGARLTNATDGGDGVRGYSPSPEIRARLSAANMGKRHSDESIARGAAKRRGLKRKPESIEKSRAAHCERIIRIEDGTIFPSMLEAAHSVGVSRGAIFTAVKFGRTRMGFYWQYVDRENVSPHEKKRANIKYVRNIDTGMIFNSLREAAISVSRHSGSLVEAIQRGRPCGGYYWVYVDEFGATQSAGPPQKRRRVLRVEDGKIYDNATRAAEDVNVTNASISRAIKTHSPCAGYYWRYIDGSE